MAKRYFKCNEKGSDKFWNINIILDEDYDEYKFIVNYGETGTKGQTEEMEFTSQEECEKEAHKLIMQQINEGYVESMEVDLYYFMGVLPDEAETDEQLFNDDSIKKIESELGYKIPQAYIDLMMIKNGDEEYRNIGDDMLEMTGFEGIDSLLNMKENTEDWGYPDLGIYFSWTESAGHEALLMNYNECFTEGEPSIWLLDQECEYGVFLAKNFEDFIKQLYFEDFSSRYGELIKKHYPDHYDADDGKVVKDFFDDWDFEYEG